MPPATNQPVAAPAPAPVVVAPAPVKVSFVKKTLNQLNKVITYLQGKKTYIVGALMVLTAFEKYLTGTTTLSQFFTTVQGLTGFNGLAIVTIRAAISKIKL
jgi:hypothetical protein